MKENSFIVKSVKETQDIAEKLVKSIKIPAIILLHGDLGAGKTHFVKGLAKGAKSKGQVTSPTFTIMNCYEGKYPIYHFDMYRLSSADEAIESGLEEYFDLTSLKGISVVEWPENVQGLIKGRIIDITIEKMEEENSRTIHIKEAIC